MISPLGNEASFRVRYVTLSDQGLVEDFNAFGEPLPWTSVEFNANDVTVTGEGAASSSTSSLVAAAIIAKGTGLSATHFELQETATWADLFIESVNYYSLTGVAKTGLSTFAFSGEVAPGDLVTIELTAYMFSSTNLFAYHFFEIPNETNALLQMANIIPPMIPFETSISNTSIGVRVFLTIFKRQFPEFHQPTGTTWVKIDPGVGTADPSVDLAEFLDHLEDVPKPSSIVLAVIALAALGVVARQRRLRQVPST